jgi:hypothetical protein
MSFKEYSKRDSYKEFFLLPNDIFNMDLSMCELAVYSYLLRCEDRKTFECHPSYRTIGKSIGASINTVKKYVELLEEKRLISTQPTKIMTKDFRKLNGTLLYKIHPIEEALQYYYQRQLQKIS